MNTKMTTAFAGALGAGMLATGCASTATGASSTAIATTTPNVTLAQTPLETDALVVIRYPAVVADAARPYYQAAYATVPIGGQLRQPVAGSDDAKAVADSAIIKSNYFAMSLYKELRERLPEGTVALSPHTIELAADGASLTSSPLSETESFPTALTVDFAAYSFPDFERMMEAEPLTFGDLVTPLMVIHTDHRAMAPTDGVMVASEPLVSSTASRAYAAKAASIDAIQNGSFEADAQPLDFVAFLNNQGGRAASATGGVGAYGSNAVGVYPLEKLRMDQAAMQQMVANTTAPVDPLESAFSSAAADRVVAALQSLDLPKTTMVERAAAVSKFDPNIGALALTGVDGVAFEERLNLAETLLDAERQFITVRSDKLFSDVYEGEIGTQTREMLRVEYDAIEERRRLARQQNTATAVAFLATAAAIGVGASTNGSSFGEQLAVTAAATAAVGAAAAAFNFKIRSDLVGEQFLVSMAPSLQQQVNVNVQLLDGDQAITAATIAEFREKTLELYEERARGLDSVATECGFVYQHDTIVGKWLGECGGGRGEGSGVGVVAYDDGTLVEYYGKTVAGKPEGVGYLIVHDASGSYAIEGGFKDGRPDGVVSVARAGQASELRVYEGGQDTGRAPADAQAPKLFEEVVGPDLVAFSRQLAGLDKS